MDLLQPLIFMILAFVLYTIGLWKSRGYCYIQSVSLFGIGLISDGAATYLMYNLSDKSAAPGLHSYLGILAIILMFILASLGTYSLVFYKDNLLIRFRQLALLAYGVWLISLITGIFRL